MKVFSFYPYVEIWKISITEG
jgi:hypothetical protein